MLTRVLGFLLFLSMVGFAVTSNAHAYMVDRLEGKNRFATAASISQEGWDNSEYVVLSFGYSFPDSLAGTSLAHKLNAPILLTHKDTLTEETKKELYRLGVSKAIILGGKGAVSDKVEAELTGMDINFERIGGKNRFETSALIAKKLGAYDKAVVAYGFNFPDALAIAPYAARNGYPILLTNTTVLPEVTKNALNSVKETIVVGGKGIISDNILSELPKPTRISGYDRFGTAAKIIETLQDDANDAYVSTGYNFADALTGSVLAAKTNGAMLLVRPDKVPEWIDSLLDKKKFSYISLLGSKSVVSDSVGAQMGSENEHSNPNSAMPIHLNQEYSGKNFGSSYPDYYKFTLTQPGIVDLSLANHPEANWYIVLREEGGDHSPIGAFSSEMKASGITSKKLGLKPGNYYIELYALGSSGDYRDIRYNFKVEPAYNQLHELELNNSFEAATPIYFDNTYKGFSDKADFDYYRFDLLEAANVKLTYNDSSNKLSFNLYKEGGNWVSYQKDTTVNLPKGRYYVIVQPSEPSRMNYNEQLSYTIKLYQ
jgi:putative cell wall-binding protein